MPEHAAVHEEAAPSRAPERAARRSRRVSFAALALTIVFLGLFSVVALNVAADQQAFTAARLQQVNTLDQTRVAVLQARVDALAAPSRLQAIASAHGMQAAQTIRVAPWPGRSARGVQGGANSTLTAASGGSNPFVASPGRSWPLSHPLSGRLPTP